MTKIIDLRPNKKFLNVNFKKYRFCSDTVLNKKKQELQTEILDIKLNAFQNSWLEAKLFAYHNHLFKNPYDSSCWFIDKDGGIWKFKDDGSLNLIYTSNSIDLKLCNLTYNPSIAFASKNIYVFCNGGGTLQFLIEFNEGIKHFTFFDTEPAIIIDAKFIKEPSELVIAMYKIDEYDGKKFSKLFFLFYKYEQTDQYELTIKFICKKILKVKGVIEYVYIETNGKFCHIISQDQVEFESDFTKVNEIKSNLDNKLQIKNPYYFWSQDIDSIILNIKIPENYNKFIPKVEVTLTSLSITIADLIILNGKTSKRLEPELTTWKQKEHSLVIELFKFEKGLMWHELLKGDTGGKYLPNEILTDDIHSRLSHLCTDQQDSIAQSQPMVGFNSEQLEDCDLSGSENILQRVNLDSHNITHLVMFSSRNRILFIEKKSFGQMICSRHDHDGCIWIIKESDTQDWELEHIHTFPGFGYVEASKKNKKFCVSSSDGSFIAIIEDTKHAFLYEKPENNAHIGRQRVLDFGSEISPILGAAFLNKYLIILTKNVLYQLQVYS